MSRQLVHEHADQMLLPSESRSDGGVQDEPVDVTVPEEEILVAAETSASFEVNSPESANWLVRKLAHWRQYRERVDEWHQQEVRRATSNEDFLMARYGQQLRLFAAQEISKLRGRAKSLNYPAGRVGFRVEKPKLIIDDEASVIRWARTACPAVIVVSERLSKTALNDYVQSTGELPAEGARYLPGGSDKLYVST